MSVASEVVAQSSAELVLDPRFWRLKREFSVSCGMPRAKVSHGCNGGERCSGVGSIEAGERYVVQGEAMPVYGHPVARVRWHKWCLSCARERGLVEWFDADGEEASRVAQFDAALERKRSEDRYVLVEGRSDFRLIVRRVPSRCDSGELCVGDGWIERRCAAQSLPGVGERGGVALMFWCLACAAARGIVSLAE